MSSPAQYWKGRQIWVLGASSGIGRAVAEQLASYGAKLILSSRPSDSLQALCEQLNAVYLPIDLNAEDQTIDFATAGIKHLDGVLYSAGVCHYLDSNDFDMEKFKASFQVNLFAVASVWKAALPLLKKSTFRPMFAAVSSLSTLTPFPKAHAYGGSKASLNYFMGSLQVEHRHWIQVSNINPGFVTTPMTAGNDFDMPFEMTSTEASRRISEAIAKGKEDIVFPARLKWLISIMSRIPFIWKKVTGQQQ